MERLTIKKDNEYKLVSGEVKNGFPVLQKHADKLGQLEDIEEELGVDLTTLFKALKNGIWVKENISENEHLLSHYITYISNRSYGFVCIDYEYISYYEVFMGNIRKEMNFYFKDYGKTWSLTKEEIENE